MKGVGLKLSVLLPLVGIALLIARGELMLRAGKSFRIGMTGYDPRDLLSGHYLQYAYDLDWQGESSCGELGTNGQPLGLDAACCVCLTSRGEDEPPAARQVVCEAARSCDGWLHSASLTPPRRYFVPEERASALEAALRQSQASLDVSASPDGEPALGELYLDGRPWREVLEP
jgi:GDYXXLXY protein